MLRPGDRRDAATRGQDRLGQRRRADGRPGDRHRPRRRRHRADPGPRRLRLRQPRGGPRLPARQRRVLPGHDQEPDHCPGHRRHPGHSLDPGPLPRRRAGSRDRGLDLRRRGRRSALHRLRCHQGPDHRPTGGAPRQRRPLPRRAVPGLALPPLLHQLDPAHRAGRHRPPPPRDHRNRVRRPDRRTPGPPALRALRRQLRLGPVRRDRAQPAPHRRHPRRPTPHPRPRRHPAPPTHRRARPSGPNRTPGRPAPTRRMALGTRMAAAMGPSPRPHPSRLTPPRPTSARARRSVEELGRPAGSPRLSANQRSNSMIHNSQDHRATRSVDSGLVLKLLVSDTHGSLIAAATCSLPERLGGVRNWDYRYTWIRDASFTLYALIRLGYTEEATAFMRWIEARCAELNENMPLQVMYGVDGRQNLEETTLSHFEGYRRSRPVRIGNGAHNQLQLDIYGELMDSVYLYNKFGELISYDFWSNL